VRTATGAVDEAREIDQTLSLCFALGLGACPIMLWVGDLATAERYVAMLLDHSARHGLPSWGALGRTYQGVLATKRGDPGFGLRHLHGDLDVSGGSVTSMMFLNELSADFARAGKIAEGLAAVEQAIERAERTGARWLFPESLRVRGELLLLQAETGARSRAPFPASARLGAPTRRAVPRTACRDKSRGLLRDQGSPADARAVLQPVYDRFTEGFDTADLKATKALLDALEPADGFAQR
jgi:hypothetical protein